ncbi:hypothetical protein UFOVP359_128 [uncultured Caudovirales phage]|uniref:Uncharacterized protein n=1 Tax=uncultured Caudovirales phage TaxID=2100421 RepID=A0A6J7WVA6_9CAUD|nr:hypothetical protein UFOVP359_128 [uncultured Caudovirales phage]
MLITDYEQAHSIVQANKNLFWDGWNIVDWKADTLGEMSKDGMLRDGKWGLYKVYSPNENGWEVPSRYAR